MDTVLEEKFGVAGSHLMNIDKRQSQFLGELTDCFCCFAGYAGPYLIGIQRQAS